MLTPETVLQNRYRIVRHLGEGGMGAVYEAVDMRLHCTVALKETFAATEDERRAFEREARLLANLRHSVLPKVMDHFSEGPGQFLVMEFIEGSDFDHLLSQQALPFTVEQVLPWAEAILRALEHLHTRQPPICHRDIKPSNIKLTSDGDIYLLDFGLAKGSTGQMTQQGHSRSVYGYTPHYASPEQMQGAGTDERSDLYSLASTLYHLLTGVQPPDALTRMYNVSLGKPDPLTPADRVYPRVPPGVAAVLSHSLALDKERRFATAAQVRRALHEAWNSVGRQEGAAESFAPQQATGAGVPFVPSASPSTPPLARGAAHVPPTPPRHAYGADGGLRPTEVVHPPPVFTTPGVGHSRRWLLWGLFALIVAVVGVVGLLAFKNWQGTTVNANIGNSNLNNNSNTNAAVASVVVAARGGGQFTSIAQALAFSAQPGARILVRPGVYNEQLLLARNVEIVGDGPVGEIVIDAKGTDATITTRGDEVLLRGLTIRNSTSSSATVLALQGRLTIEDSDIASSKGDGVSAIRPAEVTLRRTKVHNCGMNGVELNGGKGVLENSEVYSNTEVGLLVENSGTVTMRGGRIHQNTLNGVRATTGGTATVEGCEVTGNGVSTGNYSGFWVHSGSTVTIRRARISGSGGPGISIDPGGVVRIDDSIVEGNSSFGPYSVSSGAQLTGTGNTPPVPSATATATPSK